MTVLRDRQGPDWPLGLIAVATPGTPVGIMSLVDAASSDDPSTPTPTAPGPPSPAPGKNASNEYTNTCQQIIFQGYKAGSGTVAAMNSGLVYIIRKGSAAATDTGTIVKILQPGETWVLASAATNLNVFSPYRYLLDADNAGDGALVTLLIQ
jgi:hypothetical protein